MARPRLFRVPERHVAAARRACGVLVHVPPGDTEAVVTAATAAHLARELPALRALDELPLDADRWDATDRRLHRAWAAFVSEPLPENACAEARLMLYFDPDLELEFMGRGQLLNDKHLPAPKEHMVALDVAGGRRTYLFRKLQRPHGHPDERLTRATQLYGGWRAWLNDRDARVVVSIGGGGFRLFAATPVLKALEKLAGDRSRIDELWGSSGGAFLTYLYAAGFSLDTVDQFAFDLYNDRLPHLVTGSPGSFAKERVRAAWSKLKGEQPAPEMAGWLAELERRNPPERRARALPHYTIASSTQRSGLTALTSPEHLSPECGDFMIGCDPRLAVAASTAVPFLLRPVRGIGDRPDETWFDGSISDENPLALPFVKWVRERAARPDEVPPRLKIVLVNLNLRAAESELLRQLGAVPGLRAVEGLGHGWRVLDMLLDSKTTTNIRIVTALPGVEVMSVKLNLGWLNLQNPKDIAKAVRSGRTMESWEITLHGAGRDPAPASVTPLPPALRGAAMGLPPASARRPAPPLPS
ncbi:MAG TPA: patatin-like phospholipase family protein [Polyangiaceae bacterium]|nr:patatin-like phospholipase family protein [Polyangiaceae bacterium]